MPDNSRLLSESLSKLVTETQNPALAEIDLLSTEDRLRAMNQDDARVPAAVAAEIPAIARAVQAAAGSFRMGGRLIYIGAGSSGRIGVLDASECPPTFGVPASLVVGIIAGGPKALTTSIEGAEDDPGAGAQAVRDANVDSRDTVVGISASGRAPYVIGALAEAGKRGATTIGLANNRPSEIEDVVSIMIAPIVGPEVLSGSTRLKSGTSQKLVLNMISTGAMIEIGKTYGNLMVDVKASNLKLQVRAVGLVAKIAGVSREMAVSALAAANGSAKLAVLIAARNWDADRAQRHLDRCNGFLRTALTRDES